MTNSSIYVPHLFVALVIQLTDVRLVAHVEMRIDTKFKQKTSSTLTRETFQCECVWTDNTKMYFIKNMGMRV